MPLWLYTPLSHEREIRDDLNGYSLNRYIYFRKGKSINRCIIQKEDYIDSSGECEFGWVYLDDDRDGQLRLRAGSWI